MIKVNDNFLKIPQSYLFSEIARKVAAYKLAHPQADIIRLGIGDVTRPLPPAVIEAMHRATDEMASAATFRGYGPEHGYDFLQEAIIMNDYEPRGVQLVADEVFVNDGAKSDTGNIGDILSVDNRIALTDPIYPVYLDSNAMAGRAGTPTDNGHWSDITYLPCTNANGFVPDVPTGAATFDVVYLCYPNNPTGAMITRQQLQAWVDYALANNILIMYDAAYEAYITDNELPHSIYEIPGAKRCAIEFRSYSKTAGFTGQRCGYTIVPLELTAQATDGNAVQLNPLWNRRQCTKFNGTAYVTQRAAEAIYSPEGKRQVRETIDYYMENARILRKGLHERGYEVYGGINAPYIWLRTPEDMSSWDFFDHLLQNANIVGTPGVGFGPAGEGYFRLTAFGKREDCVRALERL